MKVFFLTGAAFAGLLCAPAVWAGSLASGCPATGTLFDYVGISRDGGPPPFECSVGILNFTDFRFQASETGGASLLSDSQIEVTPVPNGTLGGGFMFSAVDPIAAPFAVGAGQTATYFIDWLMAIDPGPVGMGADLGMDPPFGGVQITQSYCPDGSLDGRTFCSTGFQSLSVNAPPCADPVIPAACTSHIDFSPAIQNFAEVETTIVITGGSVIGAGFDSITGTTEVVTPEPFTFMLSLGGMVATGLLRKRRV